MAPGRLRLEEVYPLKAIRPLAHLSVLLALMMTLVGLEPDEERFDIRRTRNDPGMNVGHWIGIVISAVVLLIVLAALFPTLQSSLASYAANDTSGFGAILVILVPVLIGVAVLLAFVYAFLPRAKGKGA
jgi:H+/Cl- antiporter ClcA